MVSLDHLEDVLKVDGLVVGSSDGRPLIRQGRLVGAVHRGTGFEWRAWIPLLTLEGDATCGC